MKNWKVFSRILFGFFICLGSIFISLTFLNISKWKARDIQLDNFSNLEIKITNWIYNQENNDEKNKEKALIFLQDLETFSKSSDRYVSLNSLFFRGIIHWIQKDYEMAASVFESTFFLFKNSTLGIKAGLNAAMAYQNLNNIEKAIYMYREVSKRKKIKSFWKEAYFNLALLYLKNDPEKSLIFFKELANKLPNGDYWKSLAENYILRHEISFLS